MASHHEWWSYGSNQNQYLDTEELSSTPICMEVYFPGLANNRSLQDKVRKTCRSMGLEYSISGSAVSVSGYPCSEHMDEDYVLMVFESLDDRARLA